MMQFHTVLKLARDLRLLGIADVVETQQAVSSHDDLSFIECLGTLLFAEREKRHNAMLQRLTKDARLKLTATL